MKDAPSRRADWGRALQWLISITVLLETGRWVLRSAARAMATSLPLWPEFGSGRGWPIPGQTRIELVALVGAGGWLWRRWILAEHSAERVSLGNLAAGAPSARAGQLWVRLATIGTKLVGATLVYYALVWLLEPSASQIGVWIEALISAVWIGSGFALFGTVQVFRDLASSVPGSGSAGPSVATPPTGPASLPTAPQAPALTRAANSCVGCAAPRPTGICGTCGALNSARGYAVSEMLVEHPGSRRYVATAADGGSVLLEDHLVSNETPSGMRSLEQAVGALKRVSSSAIPPFREAFFQRDVHPPRLVLAFNYAPTSKLDSSPGALEITDLVRRTHDTLRSLGEIHRRGLAHGDVRLSDLEVNPAGGVWVLGLGRSMTSAIGARGHQAVTNDVRAIGRCANELRVGPPARGSHPPPLPFWLRRYFGLLSGRGLGRHFRSAEAALRGLQRAEHAQPDPFDLVAAGAVALTLLGVVFLALRPRHVESPPALEVAASTSEGLPKIAPALAIAPAPRDESPIVASSGKLQVTRDELTTAMQAFPPPFRRNSSWWKRSVAVAVIQWKGWLKASHASDHPRSETESRMLVRHLLEAERMFPAPTIREDVASHFARYQELIRGVLGGIEPVLEQDLIDAIPVDETQPVAAHFEPSSSAEQQMFFVPDKDAQDGVIHGREGWYSLRGLSGDFANGLDLPSPTTALYLELLYGPGEVGFLHQFVGSFSPPRETTCDSTRPPELSLRIASVTTTGSLDEGAVRATMTRGWSAFKSCLTERYCAEHWRGQHGQVTTQISVDHGAVIAARSTVEGFGDVSLKPAESPMANSICELTLVPFGLTGSGEAVANIAVDAD